MAFWGKSFVFNDVPCDDFALMLYEVGSNTHSSGEFASGVSIVEDKVGGRWKPYFYGTEFEDKLKFTMVFGADQKRIDAGKYLARDELDVIATWLTGHNRYLWLEIEQEDLDYVRYKAIVTNLEIIEYGLIPWALKATIECDSPFAYMYPQEFEYRINGQSTISFYNESSLNGYYMPKIEWNPVGTQPFSITNLSDSGRVLAFDAALPTVVKKLSIDNEHCIIQAYDGKGKISSINPYPYFNFKFFRLVKGYNELTVTGNGTLIITCEFPINVGG